MQKRIRLALDLAGLAVFAAGLVVALAVLSHDPADPPTQTVYPANAQPTNILGTFGAKLAHDLVEFLGIAVYPLLGAWLVAVLTLVLEGRLGVWSWRLLGWITLVPSVAVLADAIGPTYLNGPGIGPGGLLGAAINGMLAKELAAFGRSLVLAACNIGAVLLIGDFLWPRLLHVLAAWKQRRRQYAAAKAAELKRKARQAKAAPPAETKAEPAPVPIVRHAAEPSVATEPGLVPKLELGNERPAEVPAREPEAPAEERPPIPIRHVEAPAEELAPSQFSTLPPVSEQAIPVSGEEASLPSSSAETSDDAPEPASNGDAVPVLPGAEMPAPAACEINHPEPTPTSTPRNDYQLPPFDLLQDPEPFPYEIHDQQLRERASKLEKTFTDFGLNIRVVGINTGPVITQYEVALETGLRVHKVTRLADDLALNLKVPSVRMVAPVPGKDTVGVEIPNEHRAVVRLREVILAAGKPPAGNGGGLKAKIPLFLGKDTEGRPLVYDLADMPHLLIAGRTGTGKSVCMNAIILSILMTRRPDDVQMIMIDPKMLELSEYGKIPHLMHPVVKDMKKAEAILAWAVDKMEERYDLLSRARVRGIAGYNELSPEEIYRRIRPVDDDERARIPERMPYIIIFVDEMNDLMMMMRKEVEGHIIRLAQKSRAAGIHLVVATQKPTVDVITGLIKSNLPARICFQVASRSDSRVVLDEMGAEKLLGKGDMLFLQPGTSTIIRAQGTYASDAEISRVAQYLECEPAYSRELIQLGASGNPGVQGGGLEARDELYPQAIDVIVRERRGSVSLLQRVLGIGYGRAARLIDFMAEDGIVGPYNGSNAREVIITTEQWEEMKKRSGPADAA